MFNMLLLASIVGVSIYTFNRPHEWYKLTFNPFSIRVDKDYKRFLSCAWIHSNYGHLAVNMLVLFFFGPTVEASWNEVYPQFGSTVYLVTFLLSVALGNVSTYLQYRYDSSYQAVGASGGVSGVVFSYIVMYPDTNLYLYFAIPINAVFFAFLYLAYSIYMGKQNSDQVNHEAHISGALTGLVLTAMIHPDAFSKFLLFLRNLW